MANSPIAPVQPAIRRLASLLRHALAALGVCVLLAGAAAAANEPGDGRHGQLVDVAWLKAHREDVLLLDASMTPQHLAGHIPGAVSADLYRYGPDTPSPEAMQKRIQSWGIRQDSTVVIYDQGADSMATRLFFDLYYHDADQARLFVLDGGLAQWRAQGGAVTRDATPPPTGGTYHVAGPREAERVRLDAFMAATGDTAGHAVVEALDGDYHYGAKKFFDRGGHVPHAISMPSDDFFNADKTFKSPEDIRRLMRYRGIADTQEVETHCGGGVAASVPWFAMRFIAGRQQVRMYVESQLEWLRDERGLPFWTYDAPQMQKDAGWLQGWNAPMLRAFGVARLNLVDLRPKASYDTGHVPYALSIDAQDFRRLWRRPDEMAALLGAAGMDPAFETVLMTDQGLTPDVALAYLSLDGLGHHRLSLMKESVDEWALRGGELTKVATQVGQPSQPGAPAVPARAFAAKATGDMLFDAHQASAGAYPPAYVWLSRSAPPATLGQPTVSLPYAELLTTEGQPRPASELWTRMGKAGVPRLARIVLAADEPGEAAVGYYVFKLMGWPDVKVWVN